MRQDIPFGRVAGIRVGANWTVVVILGLIAWILGGNVLPSAVPHEPAAIYWTVACVAAALFLASLGAHEFSHALVARHNGLTVRSITLWMLGGVTELEGDPADAGADLRIAIAGPATSAATGALFFGAAVAVSYADGSSVATAALVWLAIMNGMLAVFNMLPGAPLDGGRVLRALLWWHSHDRGRADRAAARAGQFLGAAIVALGVVEVLWDALSGLWLILIGWFLISAAGAEGQAAAAKSALHGVRVGDVMTADPEIARGWMTVAEFIGTVVVRSRQDAFPVIGFDGTLAGVVDTALLAKVPPGQRAEIRLDRVALAVPPSYLAAPEDPAAPLLARRSLGGEVLAIVLQERQIVGMVTVSDLRQAVRRNLATAPR